MVTFHKPTLKEHYSLCEKEKLRKTSFNSMNHSLGLLVRTGCQDNYIEIVQNYLSSNEPDSTMNKSGTAGVNGHLKP